jgi:hypothetical protein
MAEGVATVIPPDARDGEHKPTIIMTRISDALAKHTDGLSQRVLCDVVTGNTDTIRLGLSHLIADGYVTPKTPHKNIKSYPDDADSGDENG